jgi:photosystem II stability/assembly factor-like uncharacterized protein
MKKIMIVAVMLVLFMTMINPASALTSLSLNTWIHTSDGMGAGNPISFPDTYAIAFSPNYATDNTVYAGTYIGVYKSTDRGFTWTNNMASTQPAIFTIAISPSDPSGNTLIAGTANGILQTTDRWETPSSGIGPAGLAVSFVAYSPDYVHDHMIFAGTESNGIRAMTDTLPWFSLDEGIIVGKVTMIVFDPNYAVNHILYVASQGSGVYKGDGGTNLSSWSWTPLNTGLDTANQKFVNDIAISPNFTVDQTFFIATDTVGIYKSIDAGKHWNVAFDNLAFQTLLFSPNYAKDQTVYAGEDGSGVYHSKDGGATWNQFNHGFANPVHGGSILTLVFAPGKPIILFAGLFGGSDGGVWQFLFPSSHVYIPAVSK